VQSPADGPHEAGRRTRSAKPGRVRGTAVFRRWWLCLPVATLGAALADLCLESASEAGLFGPNRFTDNSNADIAPALLIGLALTAGLLLRFALAAVVHLRGDDVTTVRSIEAGAIDRDLRIELWGSLGRPHWTRGLATFAGACYALQLVILCGMENAEQIAVYGHILGPWLWLGAPAAVALTVHALVCAGIIAILDVSLCRVLTCVPRLAQAILCYRERVPETYAAWHSRWRQALCPAPTSAAAGRRGQRSPPPLARPLIVSSL
jgi:hypothetical protein